MMKFIEAGTPSLLDIYVCAHTGSNCRARHLLDFERTVSLAVPGEGLTLEMVRPGSVPKKACSVVIGWGQWAALV